MKQLHKSFLLLVLIFLLALVPCFGDTFFNGEKEEENALSNDLVSDNLVNGNLVNAIVKIRKIKRLKGKTFITLEIKNVPETKMRLLVFSALPRIIKFDDGENIFISEPENGIKIGDLEYIIQNRIHADIQPNSLITDEEIDEEALAQGQNGLIGHNGLDERNGLNPSNGIESKTATNKFLFYCEKTTIDIADDIDEEALAQGCAKDEDKMKAHHAKHPVVKMGPAKLKPTGVYVHNNCLRHSLEHKD